MMVGGSRISQHLRECNHQSLGLGLGFCSTRIVQLSSLMVKPPSVAILGDNRHRLQQRLVSSSSLQSKSPDEIPIFSDCFSQPEDDHELPSEGLSPVAGGIVALGKFDALHIGHRELAIQASKVGAPYLLSFVGMAEVFGWEPRAPIVAKCDRKRVLSSWAPFCGNVVPAEFQIKFSSVRHLSPRQFVEKLSKELGVCGVVAGENYRFGYKAAGDASELVRLCEEYGMGAYIISSVMDKNQDPRITDSSDLKDRGQVSSTRVRHALAKGDIKYVSELLGRRHRLILMMKDQEGFLSTSSKCRVSAPKSCWLNLPPKDGLYENCSLLFGDENPVTCRVFIDSTHVHLEMDKLDDGMASIGRGLPSLQSLDVSYCWKLTDWGLSAIAEGCHDLQSLSLTGCRLVTDGVLRALSKNCHNLEELLLQGCTHITDSGLEDLVNGCQQINFLDIKKCSNVGDVGVFSVSKACSYSLKTLIIGSRRDISDECIKSLLIMGILLMLS